MASTAWTKFGSGFSTSDTVSIAARTKKLPVNHHVPLDYYLATADSLLKQGQVYRDQGCVIDCYVLLLRFASLVCETIPDHRNYRMYKTELKIYRRKLNDVLSELEKLKPEVEEEVRQQCKAADIKVKRSKSKPTLREKECGICAEMRPSFSFISTKDCVHGYCTKCCRQHAEVRVMSGRAQVDCPHPDCVHAFHISQCAALLSGPSFDILSTRLTEAAIPAAHKVFCPFQDCSFLMERSEDEEKEGTRGPFAVCFACHRGFCLECKVPWHGSDRSCAEYRAQTENAKKGGDQKLRELAKEMKWQVCPDCAVVVELKGGCYHITCRCKTEFCYLCQKKWEKKKPTCKCKLWDERNIIDHRQRVF